MYASKDVNLSVNIFLHYIIFLFDACATTVGAPTKSSELRQWMVVVENVIGEA